jgi:hypothetical protein
MDEVADEPDFDTEEERQAFRQKEAERKKEEARKQAEAEEVAKGKKGKKGFSRQKSTGSERYGSDDSEEWDDDVRLSDFLSYFNFPQILMYCLMYCLTTRTKMWMNMGIADAVHLSPRHQASSASSNNDALIVPSLECLVTMTQLPLVRDFHIFFHSAGIWCIT